MSGKDIIATKAMTSYSKTKDLERYIRTMGVKERKLEVVDRYMNPLLATQGIPLAKSQTRLNRFA